MRSLLPGGNINFALQYGGSPSTFQKQRVDETQVFAAFRDTIIYSNPNPNVDDSSRQQSSCQNYGKCQETT